MLFGKKKKTVLEPPSGGDTDRSGIEKRKAARYTSLAGIRINGFEGHAALRDMSNNGFRMASKTFVAIMPKEQYIMQILPEEVSGVAPFELKVEVRWTRSTEFLFAAGFVIVTPPRDANLQRYVDHLKRRTEWA
ncbi:MAG: PilZ domain-containing protein [Treponema sp.]|jgi:hypothetical protein|nr:PilZ domain-containing protein [Treponema sp.]